MYVCMYVCMYVHTYVCMYVCIYVHMYVHVCMFVCLFGCLLSSPLPLVTLCRYHYNYMGLHLFSTGDTRALKQSRPSPHWCSHPVDSPERLRGCWSHPPQLGNYLCWEWVHISCPSQKDQLRNQQPYLSILSSVSVWKFRGARHPCSLVPPRACWSW